MKSVRLGKSGLVVSAVGFGGIPIIPLQIETAVAVINHCYEGGVTFFDTANMYGQSEEMIGTALAEVRDKVVIATKTTKRGKAGAAEHIDLSLKRLKTDFIDLYQLHNLSLQKDLDKVLGPNGAMEAINSAVKAGKIRQVGVTSHKAEIAIKACETGLFSTLQFPFNFIETEPLDELFPAARKQDMGIIAMKPLGGGLLEKASLCFKFLQQYPDVVPIPGISKQEEFDQILEIYQQPQVLSEKEQSEMEAIRQDLGKNFCHRCGYCQPCDQKVAIPEILMFRSTVRRMPPAFAAMLSKPAMDTVDDCNECGQCLEKCPYDLQIPKLIRKAKEMFNSLRG